MKMHLKMPAAIFPPNCPGGEVLTHWGWVTHICIGNLTIIGPDNGLSPGQRQAIIWTNAGISLIGPLGTNFSEILAEIITFSSKKMYLKVLSAKRRPFCLGLNVLIDAGPVTMQTGCWTHKRDKLYVSLTGEQWGVCCDYIGENGACYNSINNMY